MFIDSGYIDKINEVIVSNEVPLLITCCGHYSLVRQNKFVTYRKEGREDYQILYFVNGKGNFTINGETVIVQEGELLVFRPGEIQDYEYCKKDSPEIYWVHFTGYDASSYLKDFDLNQYGILKVGIHTSYINLFISMIRAIQIKDYLYQDFCTLYFQQLILTIRRNYNNLQNEFGDHNKFIKNVEEEFQLHYNETTEIQEYAKKYNISLCWFIRLFKSKTGMTPQVYINEVRIQKSKEYLLNTDYNIAEVAGAVGFADPLYFSRKFTKRVGMSPREYRKLYSQAKK